MAVTGTCTNSRYGDVIQDSENMAYMYEQSREIQSLASPNTYYKHIDLRCIEIIGKWVKHFGMAVKFRSWPHIWTLLYSDCSYCRYSLFCLYLYSNIFLILTVCLVLNDIVSTMYNKRYMDEIFKPQELHSNKAMRTVFDRLAHASIMRLNAASMDKVHSVPFCFLNTYPTLTD